MGTCTQDLFPASAKMLLLLLSPTLALAGPRSLGPEEAKLVTSFPECPSGWETYATADARKCFKYFDEWVYATVAETNCQMNGGNLASIHSREEQDFLVGMVTTTASLWIGGIDRKHDLEWTWTDGSEFDFSFWLESQPSGGQYYMAMYMGYLGAWRDLDYNDSRGYICQIRP